MMYTGRADHGSMCMIMAPTATAGLNAAPEISPTAKAPDSTVKPIARPKIGVPRRRLGRGHVQHDVDECEREEELDDARCRCGCNERRGLLHLEEQHDPGSEGGADDLSNHVRNHIPHGTPSPQEHAKRDGRVEMPARHVAPGVDHHHEDRPDRERGNYAGAGRNAGASHGQDQERTSRPVHWRPCSWLILSEEGPAPRPGAAAAAIVIPRITSEGCPRWRASRDARPRMLVGGPATCHAFPRPIAASSLRNRRRRPEPDAGQLTVRIAAASKAS